MDSVVPYLVDMGVIDEFTLADESLTVDAVTRRNQNVRVVATNGSGFFVKQADPLSAQSRESVAAEGRFYAGVHHDRPELMAMLPEFVLHDPARRALILALLPEHETLRRRCSMPDSLHFPIHLWSRVAERLAVVHRARLDESSSLRSILQTFVPSPEVMSVISAAGLQVLEVVQTSGIRNGLAQVADLWDPDAFTHGDVRVDNILVADAEVADDIRLIDWELCGRADPLWDVASCVEIGITMSFGRFGARDLCLPIVQSTARATWGGYHTAGGDRLEYPSPDDATKVAVFTAARLVLSALELSEMSGRLTDSAVCCLQIAENIFAEPQRAVTDLLALTV